VKQVGLGQGLLLGAGVLHDQLLSGG
jgi:hypothetical protein